MSQEDLRDLLRKRPFQPFRLHLMDGSHYDVRYQGMMIAARRVAVVAVGGEQEQGLPEKGVTVSLPEIVCAEPLESQPGAGQSV